MVVKYTLPSRWGKLTKTATLKCLQSSLCTSGCALLVALPFLWNWLWPVGLAGLVLTFHLLSKSEKLSTKAFLWQCLLFGYVFFGVVLAWIYGIHTTELIGNTIFASLFLGLTYLIMVGGLAVGFLLFGIFYRWLKLSTANWTILLIPFLFALCEFLRSVFFSVVSFGDGAMIGPYWNFGSLGFLATDTSFKYASRVVGLYGTSLLIICLVIGIFQLIRRRYTYAFIFAVPLLIAASGWWLYKTSDGISIPVAAVSVHDEDEDSYQSDLQNKLSTIGDTQLLVLPEYSYYFVNSDGKRTNYKIPENIALTVDSSTKREDGEVKNEVSYYNNQSEFIQGFQKRFLIPGGEFIPYIYHVILFYSGNTSLINDFRAEQAIKRATQAEQPFTYHDVSYGSLACSGAIAPSFYSSLTRQGAQVLTNSASISTLGVSPLYYKQASQMSKFIAVSNARPFVQSARGGSSYIITKDGNAVQIAQAADSSEVITAAIQTNKKRTLSAVFGEWVIWLSAAVLLILGVTHRGTLKKLRKRRK